jgi:hypothetical protein|tara:strand:- start:836 stop:1417 length:582 start_codon:yes stop_codon:yes gene_type:complete
MTLPRNLFFTGVPGSKWSGIAQVLESMPNVNTSDHTKQRAYTHGTFSGHKGAYFGRGMEFEPNLDYNYIQSAWKHNNGMRIIKSHDWAYYLDDIKAHFADDWIMLVYRPDSISYAWWFEAGGFNINYPNYDVYKDSIGMLNEIQQQNQNLLTWSIKENISWHSFTPTWVNDTFGVQLDFESKWSDILVSVYKP